MSGPPRSRAYLPLALVCATLLAGVLALQFAYPGGVRAFVEEELLPALGRSRPRKKAAFVKPSRGLKNCSVDLEPFGAREFSFGAIDGKPGHFVALVTSNARVTIHLDCPHKGATNPQAERYEVRPTFDRFSWDVEPDYRTPDTRIRWLHQTGDEDTITIEWHPK